MDMSLICNDIYVCFLSLQGPFCHSQLTLLQREKVNFIYKA